MCAMYMHVCAGGWRPEEASGCLPCSCLPCFLDRASPNLKSTFCVRLAS